MQTNNQQTTDWPETILMVREWFEGDPDAALAELEHRAKVAQDAASAAAGINSSSEIPNSSIDTPGVTEVPAPTDAQIEALLPKVRHRPGMIGYACYAFGDVAAAVRAAIGVEGTVASRAPDIRGLDEQDSPSGVDAPDGGISP